MSVIGRLDEQVNAVLITPLEKRGERKGDATIQDARAHERPVPSHATMRQAPGGNNKMSEQETPARPRELPVWLL
jgi:hypothetical protein